MQELFSGRMYGIWNVEGEGQPIALFFDRGDAQRELDRRQALPVDDDDRMTEYHQIFQCDLAGVWWNSYEPNPRNLLLSPREIAALHGD